MSSPEGSSVSFHRVPADLRRHAIERLARKLEAGIAAGDAFHCRITTDQELRRLNREFRGQDRATDVLSFPALNCSSFGLYRGTASAATIPSSVAAARLKPCPDTKPPAQMGEEAARNGADAQIGFVPPTKSASVRNSLSVEGIGNSPEIGFVPSNRTRVGAQPQIGFVFARANCAGDQPGPQFNKMRRKGKSPGTLRAAAPRLYLGDIAISLPRARVQARAFGHAIEQECGILMLHGLLHLLGMDHETDGGRMARAERQWRARLGLPAGLIGRVQP